MSSVKKIPVFAIVMAVIFLVWGALSYIPSVPGSPWLIVPGIVFLVIALIAYYG